MVPKVQFHLIFVTFKILTIAIFYDFGPKKPKLIVLLIYKDIFIFNAVSHVWALYCRFCLLHLWDNKVFPFTVDA